MRLSTYIIILVCFMLTMTTAKSSLQDRLPPTKSTASQKYVLLKPLSAAISYMYYTTSRTPDWSVIQLKPLKSSTDPVHHNGPVAALALVLLFCVLTF